MTGTPLILTVIALVVVAFVLVALAVAGGVILAVAALVGVMKSSQEAPPLNAHYNT